MKPNIILDIDDTLVYTEELFKISYHISSLEIILNSNLFLENESKRKELLEDFLKDFPLSLRFLFDKDFCYDVLNTTEYKIKLLNEIEKLIPEKTLHKWIEKTSDNGLMKVYTLIKKELAYKDIELIEEDREKGLNPYSSDRFYFALSQIASYYLNDKYKETVFKILGRIPFSEHLKKKKIIYDLYKLIRKHDISLYIWSKGNEKEQLKKLESLGLNKLIPINHIFIVKEKNEIIYKNTFNNLNKKYSLLIGNSIKDDIIPAIRNGFNALWVKHYDFFTKTIEIEHETYSYDRLEKWVEETKTI